MVMVSCMGSGCCYQVAGNVELLESQSLLLDLIKTYLFKNEILEILTVPLVALSNLKASSWN